MKKFLTLLMLCLSIIFNYNFIFANTAVSYAEGTVTAIGYSEAYNIYEDFRYSGKLPTSDDKVEIFYSLSNKLDPALSEVKYSRLFNNASAGDITLHFCDSEGNDYPVTEDNGTYTVTSGIEDIVSFTYDDSSLNLTVKATILGEVDLYYYGTVVEDDLTYNTEIKSFQIDFQHQGLYYKADFSGEIIIDSEDVDNYTFDEEFVKQYILGFYYKGQLYGPEELSYGVPYIIEGVDYNHTTPCEEYIAFKIDDCIDKELVNEYQTIPVYYMKDLTFEHAGDVTVYIDQEIIIPDEWDIYVEGQLVPNTSDSDRYEVAVSAGGEIEGSISTPHSYNSIEVGLVGDENFDIVGQVIYGDELGDPAKGFKYVISQNNMQVGTYNVELIMTDTETGYQENVYLTIVVTSTQKPIITLYSDTITCYKGEDLDQIDLYLRNNVQSVLLYDGSELDYEAIFDETKLIITHDIVDTSVEREYVISYKYVDIDTGLVGTVQATLSVLDRKPAISSIKIRKVEDDSHVSKNAQLPMGTAIYFTITASDPDNDSLEYYANASKGNITLDGEIDNKFIYTPDSKFSGTVTFAFYVKGGGLSSEEESFSITYDDNVAPKIILADLDEDENISLIYDETTGYTLSVVRNKEILFKTNYLVDATDNSSSSNMTRDDVTITPVGFEFMGEYSATFNASGTYSVIYSATDSAGNQTNVTVKIVLQNQQPTAQNISFEFNYDDEITFDLSGLAKDDAEGFGFVAVGGLVDEFDKNLFANKLRFNEDGTVEIEVADIYNEEERRYVPFVGKAYLIYKVIDCDGEFSQEYTITLTLLDAKAPVITPVDTKQTSFIKGRDYSDFTASGYFTAFDEVEGEILPTSIKIYKNDAEVQSISFIEYGQYKIEYIFKDRAGNESSDFVIINVISGEKPTIEMLSTSMTIDVGGNFDIYDMIYKISDAEDGSITSGWEELRQQGFLNINDSGIDLSQAGKYTIKLYFVDSDGNSSSIVEFSLTIEGEKRFPIEIFYYGAAAVGLVLIVVVIRIIVIKRRMRI